MVIVDVELVGGASLYHGYDIILVSDADVVLVLVNVGDVEGVGDEGE